MRCVVRDEVYRCVVMYVRDEVYRCVVMYVRDGGV